MQQKDPVQSDLVWQRKVRNGRYLYEDYLEAIHKTRIIGYIYLILAALYLGSISFEAENLPYVLTSFVGGVSLLFVHQLYIYKEKSITILIASIYVCAVIIEYILFGLPDVLIPESDDAYSFAYAINAFDLINLVNLISPLLYYGLKIILLYPLFEIIYREQKVRTLSDSIKRKIGIPIACLLFILLLGYENTTPTFAELDKGFYTDKTHFYEEVFSLESF